MRIFKISGAIFLGLSVLTAGFTSNPLSHASYGKIQMGTGKMTLLFDGVENGTLNFAGGPWAPGETRNATIDILNEGELDFLSSLDSGDYPEGNLINEFKAVLKTEHGETLYAGSYSDLIVTNLDTPVGDAERLKLAVQWMPPEDVDLSIARNGNFSMKVNAQQKIG